MLICHREVTAVSSLLVCSLLSNTYFLKYFMTAASVECLLLSPQDNSLEMRTKHISYLHHVSVHLPSHFPFLFTFKLKAFGR